MLHLKRLFGFQNDGQWRIKREVVAPSTVEWEVVIKREMADGDERVDQKVMEWMSLWNTQREGEDMSSQQNLIEGGGSYGSQPIKYRAGSVKGEDQGTRIVV